MAAYSSASKGIAGFGRRFVAGQFVRSSPSHPAPAAAAASRVRSMHASVYDKEVEEKVCPAVVPDDVMKQSDSEHYWGPNPKTGVFGPPGGGAGEQTQGFHSSAANINGSGAESDSVLEQKAFFRPLEDLDKPQEA